MCWKGRGNLTKVRGKVDSIFVVLRDQNPRGLIVAVGAREPMAQVAGERGRQF